MHRDTSASKLNAVDKRIWKRLWWLLVQFDVLVTLSYGRPQAINLDEADVPPIQQDDFQEDEHVDVDLMVYQSELCTIISRALRLRFGLHTTHDQRTFALRQIDTELAVWMDALPSRLNIEASSSKYATISAPILNMTYYNFLILCHRPSPQITTRVNTTAPDDLGKCRDPVSQVMSQVCNLKCCRTQSLRCVPRFCIVIEQSLSSDFFPLVWQVWQY